MIFLNKYINMEEYKKIDNEVWKDIKGYEGLYKVSNLGRILSLKKMELLTLSQMPNGYKCVGLRKNKNRKTYYIHRLVAFHFINNVENLTDIKHIDGNRGNNVVENLEFCTKYENQIHRLNFLKQDNSYSPKINYQKIDNEVWKDIKGYEGLYRVSNMGRIYSLTRKKILNTCQNKRGYKCVGLRKNGKKIIYLVHRLVALNFIDEIPNKKQVNHIDGNKTNNVVENLEWCSASENVRHRFEVLKQKYTLSKKIICKFDMNDNFIEKYESINEAARKNNCFAGNISNCARGIIKSTAGYKWKYDINE